MCYRLPVLPHKGYNRTLALSRLRFLELHEDWKSLRRSSLLDMRMTIIPKIFPVGCKLESESVSYTAGDGLQAVEEAISTQPSVASLVPPSWVAAR